jgi:hypothetical protein
MHFPSAERMAHRHWICRGGLRFVGRPYKSFSRNHDFNLKNRKKIIFFNSERLYIESPPINRLIWICRDNLFEKHLGAAQYSAAPKKREALL